LGLLATRSDYQILEDAFEMVGALENMAYARTITKMGEEIMTDMVELCTMLMTNERPDNQTTQDNTTTYNMEGDNHQDRGQRQQLHNLQQLSKEKVEPHTAKGEQTGHYPGSPCAKSGERTGEQ
jgi:hypothetical protein